MREIDEQLVLAAYYGHHRKLDKLIKQGANVHVQCEYDLHYAIGKRSTPMSCAAMRGHIRSLDVLVSHGADVNQNTGGVFLTTPFMEAAYDSQFYAMRWLIKNGADINARNGDGRTALSLVCEKSTEAMDGVVLFLLGNGADLHRKDSYKVNAAYWYVQNNKRFNEDIFMEMLERGVDIKEIISPWHRSIEDVLKRNYGQEYVDKVNLMLQSLREQCILNSKINQYQDETLQVNF